MPSISIPPSVRESLEGEPKNVSHVTELLFGTFDTHGRTTNSNSNVTELLTRSSGGVVASWY